MSMGVHRELQDYEKLYYINGGILEIIIILQQWGYTKKYIFLYYIKGGIQELTKLFKSVLYQW